MPDRLQDPGSSWGDVEAIRQQEHDAVLYRLESADQEMFSWVRAEQCLWLMTTAPKSSLAVPKRWRHIIISYESPDPSRAQMKLDANLAPTPLADPPAGERRGSHGFRRPVDERNAP